MIQRLAARVVLEETQARLHRIVASADACLVRIDRRERMALRILKQRP